MPLFSTFQRRKRSAIRKFCGTGENGRDWDKESSARGGGKSVVRVDLEAGVKAAVVAAEAAADAYATIANDD